MGIQAYFDRDVLQIVRSDDQSEPMLVIIGYDRCPRDTHASHGIYVRGQDFARLMQLTTERFHTLRIELGVLSGPDVTHSD